MALEVEVALRAEAAAEERHDHADVRLGDPERVRDAGPRGVRDLRRRPDGHAVALPLRDDRARLDRHALHGVGDVAAAHDDVGLRERGVDVALDDRREPEDVVAPAERLVALVRLPLRMHLRRVARPARPRSRRRRAAARARPRRAPRPRVRLEGRRGDAGDDVALEAHGVPREQPPVLHHAAVEHVGHVLVRDDGDHAREARAPSPCRSA